MSSDPLERNPNQDKPVVPRPDRGIQPETVHYSGARVVPQDLADRFKLAD